MSTYTDLHNRIKENLTILRKPGSKDDGMSPQKVILINPENEFYGTFNGKVNITSGTLSGLKIVDCELENVDLAGATVDGVSLGELKATVEVNTQDIEQLTADAETISAAHDTLSTGLSVAISALGIDVDKKLSAAVDSIKESIGGVVGDVGTLSHDLSGLSVKVETLSSSMLNGVVYRGALSASQDVYHTVGEFFQKLPSCCLLEGSQKPLTNGWMWRVTIDRENVGGLYCTIEDPNTGKSCKVGEGDYVIIKNHLPDVYQVIPSPEMRLDDMDIINAQNEDDVAVELLREVSVYLSGKIDETLLSAKNFTNEVSGNLSNLLVEKITDISAETLSEAKSYTDASALVLSTFLSNILSTYSNELCGRLSNRVDEEYVHKAGDTVTKLSVAGDLSVAGKTVINHDYGEAGGTQLEISKDKVELKTFTLVDLSTANDIKLKGHRLSIDLEDNKDEHLYINGTSLKKKLDDTLATAASYTDEEISEVKDHVEIRLDQVSSDTKAEAAAYSDKLSDTISGTVDTRLKNLSDDLTGYSAGLCADISNCIESTYVHISGDSIKKLSVEGDLSVGSELTATGAVSLSNALKLNHHFSETNGTSAEMSEDGVMIETHAGISLKADAKIEIQTEAPMSASAVDFTGTFKHGLKLSTDGGLKTLSVNGVSLQSTLAELSSTTLTSANAHADEITEDLNTELTQKIADVDTELNEKITSLDADLTKEICDVSADTLLCAKTYTNSVSSEYAKIVDDELTALEYNLSTWSNTLCSQISNEVNASYVHKAGDTVTKLSVAGDLNVAKKTVLSGGLKLNDGFSDTAGTYAEFSKDGANISARAGIALDSNDSISITAKGPIAESADTFSGAFPHGAKITTNTVNLTTDYGLASILVNGKSIYTSLETISDDLDDKKLDIATAYVLSNKICADVVNSGYLKALSVNLEYDSSARQITLNAGSESYSIPTNDFVKDGMLSGAEVIEKAGKKYIRIVWYTESLTGSGTSETEFPVDDLVDVYKASEDGITLDDKNVFSLKYADIQEKTGLDALSTSLYGSSDKKGWLDSLQEQIANVSSDVSDDMFLAGHLQPAVGPSSFDSLCAFFKSCDGFDRVNSVKNGAIYNVVFKDPETYNISAITIKTASGEISVGNGDVVVIHNHDDSLESIFLSDLAYDGNESGNTYLLKAGVSRYEFELEAKKRGDDDNVISSWLKQNFANTGSESDATTTTLRQELSVDNDLSVAGDACFLKNVDVADELHAPSAYFDCLSVGTKLSAKSFSDIVALDGDKLCSVADLCADLSVGVIKLSGDLSTDISTLVVSMQKALSSLDNDPLSGLSNDSKISTVISAVVEIRDTLSALRDVWKSFMPTAADATI